MTKPVVRTEYVVVNDASLRQWSTIEGDTHVDVAHAWARHCQEETGIPYRVHSVKITMELGPVIEPPAPEKRKVKRG